MGRDKASLSFGDETLLARALRLASSVATPVILAGTTAQPVPAGVTRLADAAPGAGPLAALAGALAVAPPGRVILISCDAPLIVPAVLRLLLDRMGEADACVPRLEGVPMTMCAVYATRVRPHADRLIAGGIRSLRALLDVLKVEWIGADELRRVDADLLSFQDCDTPAQYRDALIRAGLAAPHAPDQGR
jgi:molybdopterin-guanine dinucleotide biosynthesis protein A